MTMLFAVIRCRLGVMVNYQTCTSRRIEHMAGVQDVFESQPGLSRGAGDDRVDRLQFSYFGYPEFAVTVLDD